MSPLNDTVAPSGFSFENVHRNQLIEEVHKNINSNNYYGNHNSSLSSSSSSSSYLPQATKTGTTIVGMVYKDGVVLGADTRATGGTEVAEKNCEKIHYLAPNMYCCGAGTAADTEKTTDLISSRLALLRLETNTSASRVVTACTMLKRMLFRYQGHISAALVLGGVDIHGPHVYQIYPHGSTGKLPYTTMGSGSLAAMSVFEQGWTEGMTEEEAVALVKRAILAGVFNDLGSGSNCDTCVIRTDGTVEYTRGAVKPNETQPLRDGIVHSSKLSVMPGTTPILNSQYKAFPTLADVEVTDV